MYTAIVSARDSGNNLVAGTAFNWTVTEPLPTITSVPNTQTNAHGDTITPLTVSASAAADGDVVTNFALSGQPGGLHINPTSGVISGTLGSSTAAGVYNVVVTATDSAGAQDPEHFTWIVTSGVTGPTATTLGSQASKEGDAIDLPISPAPAYDGAPPVYFQISGQPSGIDIDPQTGEITGTLNYVSVRPTPSCVA